MRGLAGAWLLGRDVVLSHGMPLQTGETTWERPADMAWKAVPDAQGSTYYENEKTSEVQWEKPVVIAWEKAQFNPHVNILTR